MKLPRTTSGKYSIEAVAKALDVLETLKYRKDADGRISVISHELNWRMAWQAPARDLRQPATRHQNP
jgi:hypothetical protein